MTNSKMQFTEEEGCSRGQYIFFFNDTATTEIYTLSLHDALPICRPRLRPGRQARRRRGGGDGNNQAHALHARLSVERSRRGRSEEHTSELQSRQYLVCRLLLETKNLHDRPFIQLRSQISDSPAAR